MMTDSQETLPRPEYKRRRYYVHKFQGKYALFFGFSLFIYSLILFGHVVLTPYVMPALELTQTVQTDDRLIQEPYIAGRQFLVLSETLWPAHLALFVGVALFSIFLTHRIAGPVYHLQQSAKEFAQGNLALRIRLRKKDELHELADVTNEAIASVEQAMIEIRDREAAERGAVRQLAKLIRAQPTSLQAMTDQLDAALKEGDQIDAVFQRFRFSK